MPNEGKKKDPATTYDLALEVARRSHAKQVDKAGKPYIEHPLRVADNFRHTPAYVPAVLHDVVEDSDLTLDDIQEMFGEEIAKIVELLTRRESESYPDFISRIIASQNRDAMLIKMADLKDNMNITRLPHLGEKDMDRLIKYAKSYKCLIHAVEAQT
jgi:(p)ppGpp synthase/HD superfamily hydrolase